MSTDAVKPESRNITVFLGSYVWEPNSEELALDAFARTACLDDPKFGPVPEFDMAQRVLLIRRELKEHCGFLELLWDNLAYDTGRAEFLIQSKVRFFNVWIGMPVLNAWEQQRSAKKDEVEITVFTGKRKLFGEEVAVRFFAPLGSHGVTEKDEQRLQREFETAVKRIRSAHS